MENLLYEERLESVRKIMDLNHLDGILFTQRMKKADREAIVRKARKLAIARKEKVLV